MKNYMDKLISLWFYALPYLQSMNYFMFVHTKIKMPIMDWQISRVDGCLHRINFYIKEKKIWW